ncbi:hypothetical protein CHS0354_039910 [Potamilus streckersoni]|uniref:Rho-GAP domain-containing protein n=1 Tax=Potamilus streckersoni TaxID=2493646 RepID=A0AAE0THM1_9BIVA|nr:hypothetical protein CHS0354_039910 [Potamilus streckersoni]
MFTMTVHGDRTRLIAPTSRKVYGRKGGVFRGPQGLLLNPPSCGDKNIESSIGPNGSIPNLTLCQSWNGCTWQLQEASPPSPTSLDGRTNNGHEIYHTLLLPARVSDHEKYQTLPLPLKTRDSPISLGSGNSDYIRVTLSNDDYDSATTVSSTMDSEDDYVTLDRSYVFTKPIFRRLTHSASMVDLKHNQFSPFLPPKVQNTDIVNNKIHNPLLPQKMQPRGPLRSVSVEENPKQSTPKSGPWAKRSLRRIYENIGLVPKSTEKSVQRCIDKKAENNEIELKQVAENTSEKTLKRDRGRSMSVGDLNFEMNNKSDKDKETSSGCYTSDDDEDDFGFLNYSFVYSSAAMHKAKSPSPHHRILPLKRWRGKGKQQNNARTCLWTPQDNCTWCSVSGRQVALRPVSLLHLSEAERLTLQKIALSRLQSMNLGCPIVIPKDTSSGRRGKRRVLSFKKSKSANLSGLIDKLADREKERDQKDLQPAGLVFGIPLSKCIANDIELQRKRSSGPLKERKDGEELILVQKPRKSSSSSHDSLDESPSPKDGRMRTASTDSISDSECSRNTNSSSLIDALSLSTSRKGSLQQDFLPQYNTDSPKVPHIVQVCIKHIETYGLRVLGIFRVGSSKKKTKQLRDEFDSGKDVKLNESHNPHEIGSLLKEYFRDLPEPLFTRDLYSPLVATRGIYDKEARENAVRLLVVLLPVANRDTLWSLLDFLYKVQQHSTDAIDENTGQTLPGNKMDSHNLATLFGPNVLHKCKGHDKEFQVESMDRAEERKEVIDVVRDMIDNFQSIFTIPPSLHDEVLRLLLESDPDAADHILKKMSSEHGIEPDPDTTSSSVFDEADTSSLPHYASSDVDVRNFGSSLQPPLRVAKSAEVLTPNTTRRNFFSNQNNSEKYRRDNSGDRPKFHLRNDHSPSPPAIVQTLNTPRVIVSREKSNSPEVNLRSHSMRNDNERPISASYADSLAIPNPYYSRQSSIPNVNTNPVSKTPETLRPSRSTGQMSLLNSTPSLATSSLHPPSLGTPSTRIHRSSTSPRITRKTTSSRQRPLEMNDNEHDAPVSSPEWQREMWRHWESIAADNPADSYDQETLV